ncbi:hypothetical protein [Bacillus paranthracis]|uniref:hypothetical protein n=1 Tax=Bacillus paranthracis TaxID=2026186 RepID=UPI002FDBAD94
MFICVSGLPFSSSSEVSLPGFSSLFGGVIDSLSPPDEDSIFLFETVICSGAAWAFSIVKLIGDASN